GRFPSETICISIAWAVLDRASRGWRGLAMTPAGLRQLQDLRRSLLQPPQQLRPQHTPDSPSSTTETLTATASHHPPKPEPPQADLHRIPDATSNCYGELLCDGCHIRCRRSYHLRGRDHIRHVCPPTRSVEK